MWRPKDWEEQFKEFNPKSPDDRMTRSLFEAGADAMLEALRLKALEQNQAGVVTFKIYEDEESLVGTYVVLQIPDEEKK